MTNEMIGKRFGRLLVEKQAPNQSYPCGASQRRWVCKCDCGNEHIATTGALTSGCTSSCGCFKKEYDKARFTKHGKTGTRLYVVWKQMKKRCYNKTDISYRYYGERGITVCEEWKNSFPKFEKWMIDNGYDERAKRGDTTIDRINPNIGYCPDNCRVVDWQVQARNKRNVNANIG